MNSLSQVFQARKRESGFVLLGPHRLKEFSIIGSKNDILPLVIVLSEEQAIDLSALDEMWNSAIQI